MREEQWILEDFVVAVQNGRLLTRVSSLPMDVDNEGFYGKQVSNMYNSSHLTISSGILEFDEDEYHVRN